MDLFKTYSFKDARKDSDRAIDSYRDRLFVRFDTEYQKQFGTFTSLVLAFAFIIPLSFN